VKKILGLLSITTLLLASSCETKVDVLDEYKQIPVVYGILDPGPIGGDTEHYIRITRTYLGGNVLEGAQVADSSEIKGITPVMEEVTRNGDVVSSQELVYTTFPDKEEGVFFSSPNNAYLYSKRLDTSLTYRLKFEFNGEQVSTETRIAKKPRPSTSGILGRDEHQLYIKAEPSDYEYAKNKLAFNGSNSEMTYEIHYRLAYTEVHHNGNTFEKEVPFRISKIDNPRKFIGIAELTNELEYINALPELIRQNTDDESKVKNRKIGDLTVRVYAAAFDLATYLQVNTPISSVSQEKPNFTNVKFGDAEGVGVFSSRVYYRKIKTLSSTTAIGMKFDPILSEFKFCREFSIDASCD
jgi:hypothetical protein